MKNKYQIGENIDFEEFLFGTGNNSGIAVITDVLFKEDVGEVLYEVKRLQVIDSRGKDITHECEDTSYLLLESEITGLREDN